MVEESIAYIEKLRIASFLEGFDHLLGFEQYGSWGSVLVNQTTVHSGGVIAGGGSVAVAVGAGDR